MRGPAEEGLIIPYDYGIPVLLAVSPVLLPGGGLRLELPPLTAPPEPMAVRIPSWMVDNIPANDWDTAVCTDWATMDWMIPTPEERDGVRVSAVLVTDTLEDGTSPDSETAGVLIGPVVTVEPAGEVELVEDMSQEKAAGTSLLRLMLQHVACAEPCCFATRVTSTCISRPTAHVLEYTCISRPTAHVLEYIDR